MHQSHQLLMTLKLLAATIANYCPWSCNASVAPATGDTQTSPCDNCKLLPLIMQCISRTSYWWHSDFSLRQLLIIALDHAMLQSHQLLMTLKLLAATVANYCPWSCNASVAQATQWFKSMHTTHLLSFFMLMKVMLNDMLEARCNYCSWLTWRAQL